MSRQIPNFKSVILRQRLDEIRLRVLAMSKFNVDNDRQRLRELREQAHIIGDTDLELYALNIYGLSYTVVGDDNMAYVIFQEGAAKAQEWDNLDRWVTFRLNLGVIHHMRRDLQAARRIFEDFLPTLTTFAMNTETLSRLHLTYCYLALLCVDLNDFDAAERYARSFLDQGESPEVELIQQGRRVELMSMARDALSSVYLAREQYAQARSQAGLMLGISLKAAHPLQTISAYLALLRVSVFTPEGGTEAEEDWRRVVDTIAPLLTIQATVLWRVGSQVLMRDAQMYGERGKIVWARRCAAKSLEIMTALGNEEHCQIAERFLAALPSA